METPDPLDSFHSALEARHLSELTFKEVRHALQALSSLYVERRERMADGAALDGAGKRAAFALYYGPMHFLLVREIVRALALRAPRRILDLGCGTGTAGAAWALECRAEGPPRGRRPQRLGRRRRPAGPSPASASTAARPEATRRPPPAEAAGRHPRRVHRERARRGAASAAARAARRCGATPARPSSSSSRSPGASPRGGRSGPRPSAPPAGARTSGASARPCPTASPSSAKPPASTPAS